MMADPAWVLQAKEDGHHLLAYNVGGLVIGTNRRGEPHAVPDNIARALKALPDGAILDGEKLPIYRNGGVSRWVYVVYDCLHDGKRDLRGDVYVARWEALVVLTRLIGGDDVRVIRHAESASAKRRLWAELEAEAGEGVIFKHRDAQYKAGRPSARGAKWSMRRAKFRRRAEAIVFRRPTDTKASLSLFLYPTADAETPAYAGGASAVAHNDWFNEIKVGEARIAEIEYQYASADHQFIGAQIKRWRDDDKEPRECTWDQLVIGRRYRDGKVA